MTDEKFYNQTPNAVDDEKYLRIRRPNGGKAYCGFFKSEEEAAREYDKIVSEEIPNRIYRNFPVKQEGK